MSAEADRLDREAQQLENEARQLDETAGYVRNKGRELLSVAVDLHRPFRDSVGSSWQGPQAERFLHHNEARLNRMRNNEGTLQTVARRMEEAARRARDEARQKRERASQLRREEEERRRNEAAHRR